MNVSYFLSSNNQVTGPYSREELINSLADGTVTPESLVREASAESWHSITTLTNTEGSPSTAIVPSNKPLVSAPVAYYGHPQPKDSAIAILLELLPGMFMQTFGIGNIYAGNIALGIVLMFSYWALTVINFLLVFVAIGFITWPLTFIVFMVLGIVSAQQGVERANWRIAVSSQQ